LYIFHDDGIIIIKESDVTLKKLKIYLDTSLISHLEANDTPDKMASTLELWKEIKQNKYDVYISDMVVSELFDCQEPKRSTMFRYLAEIDYTELVLSDETKELADKYINEGIIPMKNKEDAMHIAVASINVCDIIVSWNFKHMVKFKTIRGVNAMNKYMGYSNEIEILSPDSIIEEE